MKKTKLILLLITLISKETFAKICSETHQSCGQCMCKSSSFWCTDDNFVGTGRCLDTVEYEDFTCQSTVSVGNEQELIQNEALSKEKLIQPQKIRLKLRPGAEQDIPIRIGQSKDYPVDLYFLLDLSFSMNESRNTLAEQGKVPS